MYLDRVVSVSLDVFVKECVWLRNLFLNSGWVAPVYTLVSPFDVTEALYTMDPERHSPSSGQLSRLSCGQLQVMLAGGATSLFRTFLLCLAIMLFMLGMQL